MSRTLSYSCASLVLTGVVAALVLSACNKSNGANSAAPADATSPASPTAGGDTVAAGSSGGEGYARPVAYSTSPPPALPNYRQPPIPGQGYVWTPGYWRWDEDAGDYYWTPGTWARPPRAGVLWTPGYWRYVDGRYGFVEGYWGPQVGFYGGVDYGYGYDGDGYEGGRWQGDQFYYNQTVNNLANTRMTNVYRQDVRQGGDRTSFNGGAGGIRAAPSPGQIAASRAPHAPQTPEQAQHVAQARATPALRASVNQGRPSIAATPRPGMFSGPGVVTHAQAAASYHPPGGAGPVQGRSMAAERGAAPAGPRARQAPGAPPRQGGPPRPEPTPPNRAPMSTREAPPRPAEQARAPASRPMQSAAPSSRPPPPHPQEAHPKPGEPERK